MTSLNRTILLGNIDGRINLRLQLRHVIVSVLLAVMALILAVFVLGLGTLPLSFADTLSALSGRANPRTAMIVLDWRLPRITMALILGAALGMSGAIFQSLIRNPLGSPDIIGFNTGAYTGVLITIVLFHGDHVMITLGALGGGLLTAVIVYLLSWRQGIQGFRLIMIGIAVSAMLTAFNMWLMITGSLETVMSAALWGAGSLNGMTWARAIPSAIACTLGMCLCLGLARRVRMMEMGDDMAGALGLSVGSTRLWLMIVGVMLVAAATAATGPVVFIALAAPQIAQRLCRTRSMTLAASACTGAVLLLGADAVAQHLFSPFSLPVGIVTVSIGGLYMLWLLVRDAS
ncbi:iron-enterobactin ABC transporter permease [Phyllobacterium sp. SB3]|uniref:iron-enterobactin ABC transporter permease n=1 Tax=Phyllobacterium sp. SB3 TaxID=3156073 RepID=UPI0032AFFDB0